MENHFPVLDDLFPDLEFFIPNQKK
jgi:hypothetical protein